VKKRWFYRLLFSYLPILFLVVSLLMFISFLYVRSLTHREMVQANDVYSRNALQHVDSSLQAIDMMFLKEIMNNSVFASFFNPSPEINPYSAALDIREKLRNVTYTYPLLDSIYLYRFSDGIVLAPDERVAIDRFPDREFLKSMQRQPLLYYWTGRRNLNLHNYQTGEDIQYPVISFVRKAPALSEGQGLIVANIRIAALEQLLNEVPGPALSYAKLLDQNGVQLASTIRDESGMSGEKTRRSPHEQEWLRLPSDYTKWKLHSGIRSGVLSSYTAAAIYFWFGIWLLAMILGTGWILFATRRNYKPMETLMANLTERIRKTGFRLNGGKDASDEFAMIESTLYGLIEQSVDYEKRHEEDTHMRQRNLFFELIEGNPSAETEELWHSGSNKFHPASSSDEYHAVLTELDCYTEFCLQYHAKDQLLLKFVVSSALNEIASRHGVRVWSEWVAPNRLCLLTQFASADPENRHILLQLCQEFVSWVGANLTFTVTVGLGIPAARITDIAASYGKAERAVHSKFRLGGNRVIGYWDAKETASSGTIDPLDRIRSLAQIFRADEENWVAPFNGLFSELKTEGYRKEDVIGFLRLFLFHLNREMNELSSEIQELWKNETMLRLDQAIEQAETLEETERRFDQILSGLASRLHEWRASKGNRAQLRLVKQFIAERYGDPDLSLNMLSEHFQIKAGYLSRIFREEEGVKLVDYILGIRMQEAKRLLKETREPVQAISEKVGYLHSLSFIRVFKRQTGVTPGEYRRDLEETKDRPVG